MKLCERIASKRVAIFTLILTCFSAFCIENIFVEIRTYCLSFTLSIALLLSYYNRRKEDTNKNRAIYYICVFLNSFTHYFNVLYAAFFGLVDLIRIIRKKEKKSQLLGYFIAIFPFIIWFLCMLKMKKINLLEFWVAQPKINDIYKLLLELFSYNVGYINIFIIMCISMFLLYKFNKKYKDKLNFFIILIFGVSFMISTVFVYSAYINPNGSIFNTRYYVVIIPSIFIIFCYFIDNIISNNINVYLKVVLLFLLLINFVRSNNYTMNCYADVHNTQGNYNEIVNEIITDKDYTPNCIVTYFGYEGFAKGIEEYFIKKRGIENIKLTTEYVKDEYIKSPYIYRITEYDWEPDELAEHFILEKILANGKVLCYKNIGIEKGE